MAYATADTGVNANDLDAQSDESARVLQGAQERDQVC